MCTITNFYYYYYYYVRLQFVLDDYSHLYFDILLTELFSFYYDTLVATVSYWCLLLIRSSFSISSIRY